MGTVFLFLELVLLNELDSPLQQHFSGLAVSAFPRLADAGGLDLLLRLQVEAAFDTHHRIRLECCGTTRAAWPLYLLESNLVKQVGNPSPRATSGVVLHSLADRQRLVAFGAQ